MTHASTVSKSGSSGSSGNWIEKLYQFINVICPSRISLALELSVSKWPAKTDRKMFLAPVHQIGELGQCLLFGAHMEAIADENDTRHWIVSIPDHFSRTLTSEADRPSCRLLLQRLVVALLALHNIGHPNDQDHPQAYT